MKRPAKLRHRQLPDGRLRLTIEATKTSKGDIGDWQRHLSLCPMQSELQKTTGLLLMAARDLRSRKSLSFAVTEGLSTQITGISTNMPLLEGFLRRLKCKWFPHTFCDRRRCPLTLRLGETQRRRHPLKRAWQGLSVSPKTRGLICSASGVCLSRQLTGFALHSPD